MKRVIVWWIGLGGIFLLIPSVGADSWMPPSTRMFASEDGRFAFRVSPIKAKDGVTKQAMGHLFRFDAKTGKPVTLWKRPLINIPVRALLFSNGSETYVVTLDTWGTVGYKDTLTFYDSQGNMKKTWKLDEFVSEKEIKQHVMVTISSRFWSKGTWIQSTYLQNKLALQLKFSWGRTVLFDLATGKLVDQPKSKVMPKLEVKPGTRLVPVPVAPSPRR